MALKVAPTNVLLKAGVAQKAAEGPLSRVFSVREACEFLGVHRNTLYRLIESQEIPAFQLTKRGSWKIRKEHLEDWVESRERRRTA